MTPKERAENNHRFWRFAASRASEPGEVIYQFWKRVYEKDKTDWYDLFNAPTQLKLPL